MDHWLLLKCILGSTFGGEIGEKTNTASLLECQQRCSYRRSLFSVFALCLAYFWLLLYLVFSLIPASFLDKVEAWPMGLACSNHFWRLIYIRLRLTFIFMTLQDVGALWLFLSLTGWWTWWSGTVWCACRHSIQRCLGNIPLPAHIVEIFWCPLQ